MKTLFTSFVLLTCFSLSAQIDNCCINPEWINPDAMCTMEWNPVVGCDGVTYGNACNASVSGVTSWTNNAGQVTSLEWDCGTSAALCTSWSGVEITEAGDWVNPNDPCDMGYCQPDGFFSALIIDCAEQMGMPCDGEWVLEDGDCCSTCVETPLSDCENIYITLNNGWNMIGFACAENTDAVVAFSPIQDKIIIAKNVAGSVYLPEWEYNGIGNLERGYGYLLKVSEQIPNFNFCE